MQATKWALLKITRAKQKIQTDEMAWKRQFALQKIRATNEYAQLFR
jgi:hypothetical protein